MIPLGLLFVVLFALSKGSATPGITSMKGELMAGTIETNRYAAAVKRAISSKNPNVMVKLALRLEHQYPETAKVLAQRAIRARKQLRLGLVLKRQRQRQIAVKRAILAELLGDSDEDDPAGSATQGEDEDGAEGSATQDEGDDNEGSATQDAEDEQESAAQAPDVSKLSLDDVENPEPLDGIDPEKWREWAGTIAGPNTCKGIRAGFMGTSLKRLKDLDYVTSLKSVPFEGSKPGSKGSATRGSATRKALVAEWKKPLSSETFLSDPELQYNVFMQSTKSHKEAIDKEYKDYIGQKINGKTVTLSGLLAVAHLAGLPGLKGWLTHESDRQKFGATTQMFEATTGVF